MKTKRFTRTELVIVAGAVILGILLVAGVVMRPFSQDHSTYRYREACRYNLKQIGFACLMYSGENDWHFPCLNGPGNNFEPLNTDGILCDGKVFVCFSATVSLSLARNSNYWYVGSGLKDDAPASTRLAYDMSGNHQDDRHWMNCLFVDGHVEGAMPNGSKTWNKYP